ncbi:MAG: DNA topoisomerase 4 subunit A [Anaerolineae bacterium]|nr:DNA topoisomerase 4 subunit A [Anaerolineae bacterium]
MSEESTLNGNELTIQVQALDSFVEQAYRRYAVLTILDRALPDVRDGLKPVQRRILYAMADMHLVHNQPHKKSARLVGEVLGKYHPHGDQSVYDAMVRMAQDFSMRSPLIDGQGNFGSIDGDSAAAMRYTETRLAALGESMLMDIDRDTVNWVPNFDGSLKEPLVLPVRFPNLLVNGATGIAVGMSTSILPHNLGEVCDAVVYMAKNWKKRDQISVKDLQKYIPGPDLPTGGLLYRYRVNGDENKVDMIRQAYETGNATLVCQAKADIQDIGGGKSEIIVTELPFQVQKSTVLERIASNRDKFQGITDVRDESDYKGMRVVFEVGRGVDPYEALERLFTHTQMRSSLSYNALALVMSEEGKASPQNLTLGKMLSEFIRHRLEVITRRSQYELTRAEARLHIVEGLLKAISMIDEVIDIIRHSQNTETARANLMKKIGLSEIQATAILDMPLRRLTSLERKKLEDEQKELKARVKELKEILASEDRRLQVVIQETDEVKEQYADPRRTVIIDHEDGHQARVTVADLVIPTEEQMVVVSRTGIQRCDAKTWKDSTPRGKVSARAVEINLTRIQVKPDEALLLVSNRGRVWQANVGRLPLQATFTELGLDKGEEIIGCGAATPGNSLVLVTRAGNVKRVKTEDCLNSRHEGAWSPIIGLEGKDDEVLLAGVASDKAEVFICTSGSQETTPRALRFEAASINPQATPSARGVAAIKMLDDQLVGGVLLEPQQAKEFVLITSTHGHIKRISLLEFPVQGRGGQGVQIWKINDSTGLVGALTVAPETADVDIYSEKGRRLRLAVKDINQVTRATKGIDLGARYANGNLFEADPVAGVVKI